MIMRCHRCNSSTIYMMSFEVKGEYEIVEQPTCLSCMENAMEIIAWLNLPCEIDVYQPIERD